MELPRHQSFQKPRQQCALSVIIREFMHARSPAESALKRKFPFSVRIDSPIAVHSKVVVQLSESCGDVTARTFNHVVLRPGEIARAHASKFNLLLYGDISR